MAIAVFAVCFVHNDYSVVLGDKSNHQPVVHVCQLLLCNFTGYVFSLDWFVSKKHSLMAILRDIFLAKTHAWLNISAAILVTLSFLAAIRFANPTHPFMLADNRHYVSIFGENLDWQIKQMASLSIF